MKQLKFNPQNTCNTLGHHASKCLEWPSWIGRSHAGTQLLPMTQKGLRANFNLPLQPRYRQQQPAAQIRTKYSTPNTTMVTISCEGDSAISRERRMMESTLRNPGQTHNLRKVHLRKYITELSAPLNREPRLERSSDLCFCVFPPPPQGAERCCTLQP